MAAKLEDNEIVIYDKSIVLGKSVAKFFSSKGMKSITIIFNHKNNSLILWGDATYNLKQNTHGFKIFYEGTPIFKTQSTERTKIQAIMHRYLQKKGIDGWSEHIGTYRAWPLNSHSIIIENVVFAKNFVVNKCGINLEHGFYVLGNFELAHTLTNEDLVRKSSIKPQIPINKPVPEQEQAQVSTENVQKTPSESEVRAENEYKKMILGE